MPVNQSGAGAGKTRARSSCASRVWIILPNGSLNLSCGGVLDMAHYVIADEGYRQPDTYRDAVYPPRRFVEPFPAVLR
jgi:hypothetical protein